MPFLPTQPPHILLYTWATLHFYNISGLYWMLHFFWLQYKKSQVERLMIYNSKLPSFCWVLHHSTFTFRLRRSDRSGELKSFVFPKYHPHSYRLPSSVKVSCQLMCSVWLCVHRSSGCVAPVTIQHETHKYQITKGTAYLHSGQNTQNI